MPIELNHAIVHARDPHASATFVSQLLGRPAPVRDEPFWDVELDNHVTLAYRESDKHLTIEHYAFLVSEQEFDQIFARIQGRGLQHWADPSHQEPGRINHHDGGRGVYWNDLDGHLLEIITRPYGSGG
jgi:catechol 2,3-dioxygenase-like lactoylglutathione lyase family enzyme